MTQIILDAVESTQTWRTGIIQDNIEERKEKFRIILHSPVNTVLKSPRVCTVTILDRSHRLCSKAPAGNGACHCFVAQTCHPLKNIKRLGMGIGVITGTLQETYISGQKTTNRRKIKSKRLDKRKRRKKHRVQQDSSARSLESGQSTINKL